MYHQIHLVLLHVIIIVHFTFPSLVVSHAAKEWVGGDGDSSKPQIFMTPAFGPVTLASFPVRPEHGTILEHGKWFKVKTSSCTLDSMRIHSDFNIGSVLGSSSTNTAFPETGKCELNGGDETEVFIELDDNNVLGIRIKMRRCLSTDLGGIWMEHKVRIEDQAGWLIEKFFFKILQNVDMHAIMNEEKRREGTQLRWICIPEQDTVTMDSGFSVLGFTKGLQPIMMGSELNASLIAMWSGLSEDGMIVTTNITADYSDCSSNSPQMTGDEVDDDSTAEVNISLDDEKEWTLSININECINSTGNFESEWFASKPLRFTAKVEIKEGSIYSRLLVVARQYVKKKNLKSDKLKEILGIM